MNLNYDTKIIGGIVMNVFVNAGISNLYSEWVPHIK